MIQYFHAARPEDAGAKYRISEINVSGGARSVRRSALAPPPPGQNKQPPQI